MQASQPAVTEVSKRREDRILELRTRRRPPYRRAKSAAKNVSPVHFTSTGLLTTSPVTARRSLPSRVAANRTFVSPSRLP